MIEPGAQRDLSDVLIEPGAQRDGIFLSDVLIEPGAEVLSIHLIKSFQFLKAYNIRSQRYRD